MEIRILLLFFLLALLVTGEYAYSIFLYKKLFYYAGVEINLRTPNLFKCSLLSSILHFLSYE